MTRGHESAEGHVTGAAAYVDDAPRAARELSLWPVTVPHARALLRGIDAAQASALPGVVRVLSAPDVPGLNDSGPIVHDEPLLPAVGEEIAFWGQPVAWVAAESEEAARAGAAAVAVVAEPLPAILTLEEAIAAGSFHGEERRMEKGDVDAALAAAPQRFAGALKLGGQDHFYLETQAARAEVDPEGGVAVLSSTQHPSETQAVVAHVLGVARNRVVVTCRRMGGGFGGKESQANPLAAVAALAAWHTGRPTRVRLRRDLDMILTGKRHPFLGRWRAGADDQGRLLALDVELFSDGGWSSDLSHAVLERAMFHTDNAYCPDVMRVTGRVARTNTASNTAFRGFGGPQGMAVVEEALDRVARGLRLPADVVRARNFYAPGRDETHYGQRVERPRVQRVWDAVRSDADWEARRTEIDAHNARAPHRKRGLAVTPVKFGISFTNAPLNQAGALVLVYADGSVQLNHGGTEMGQGLHTKMLAVASRALGVRPERVRMMPTATDKVPNTSATAASSGSDLNGQAVRAACLELRQRLAGVAARMLGVDHADDLVFDDDAIHPAGQPQRRLAFEEVTAQAHLDRVGLSATGFYRTPNLYFDKVRGRGRPFHYYAYGAAVCEVEVDGFTGQWRLRRVDVVHDVGDSLNERVDRGQIEGGFAQGMGWLTMEELVWDAEGRPRTTEPATYKIPTISEMPEAFHLRLLERSTQEGTIHGSKAVGEPPFMLALSVREAIRDAVAAFAPEGVTPARVDLAAPSTPEAIWWAIEAVRNPRPGDAGPPGKGRAHPEDEPAVALAAAEAHASAADGDPPVTGAARSAADGPGDEPITGD